MSHKDHIDEKSSIVNTNDALFDFIQKGEIDSLKQLLLEHTFESSVLSEAIEKASSLNRVDLIEVCLVNGSPPLRLALEEASRRGHLDVVVYLLGKTTFNEHVLGLSLEYASRHNHVHVVEHFLKNGISSIRALNDSLGYASFKGFEAIVRLLIKYGANDFKHAIQEANFGNQKEIVKILENI